jgi:hypothetical protein
MTNEIVLPSICTLEPNIGHSHSILLALFNKKNRMTLFYLPNI